jgi:hypothetical protein
MIDVAQLNAMHSETVARWHAQPIDNPYEDALRLACEQHAFNYRLWHEEDIARSPSVGDVRIAQVKRNIDRLNQQRNDWIEKIDDWISAHLEDRGVVPAPGARLNTETPGSAIDRLSILALRIYHLREQLARDDASAEHRASVERKLSVCHMQQSDLSQSLAELLADISSGRKRHRTYRQFKMYNDPALNPYLYGAQRKAG